MIDLVVIIEVIYILQGCIANKQAIECSDVFDSGTCYSWFEEGMCVDKNFRYIAENCKKTCDLCPVTTQIVVKSKKKKKKELICEDKRHSCYQWKNHCKEGSKFHKFMKKNCRRTCLFCADKHCDDTTTKCEHFRNRGFCRASSNNHKYMTKHCEKTCRFCRPVDAYFQTIYQNKLENYVKEYSCDFEIDECDWSNQVFDDTADWVVAIDNNGPRTGFMNSKKYIYLNSVHQDYYAYLVLPWEMILPFSRMDRGVMCFHFMYQMSDGEIIVAEQPTPTSTKKYPVSIVKYITKDVASKWTHVKVDVYVSDNYHLLLKGVKGKPGSFIAVDDIFFSDGECY